MRRRTRRRKERRTTTTTTMQRIAVVCTARNGRVHAGKGSRYYFRSRCCCTLQVRDEAATTTAAAAGASRRRAIGEEGAPLRPPSRGSLEYVMQVAVTRRWQNERTRGATQAMHRARSSLLFSVSPPPPCPPLPPAAPLGDARGARLKPLNLDYEL